MHRFRTWLALVLVSSVLSVVATAQIGGTLWYVDDTGTGGASTTIQGAINLATSGDVIVVRAHSLGLAYPGFDIGLTTIPKTLGITAELGNTVLVRPSVIANLDGEAIVAIRGLDFERIPTATGGSTQVLDVDGAVYFEDCEFTANPLDQTTVFPTGPTLDLKWAQNSESTGLVVLARCVVQGADGFTTPSGAGSSGQNALDIWGDQTLEGYDVSIWESRIRGGHGRAQTTPGVPGENGGLGIAQTTSTLWLSGNTVRGGNGGKGFVGPPCTNGGQGAEGIYFTNPFKADLIDTNVFSGTPGAGGANNCLPGTTLPPFFPFPTPTQVLFHPGIPSRRIVLDNSPLRVPAAGTTAFGTVCGVIGDLLLTHRDQLLTHAYRFTTAVCPALGRLGVDQLQVTKAYRPFASYSPVPHTTTCAPIQDPIVTADLLGFQAMVWFYQGEHDYIAPSNCDKFDGCPTALFLIDEEFPE